MFNLSLPEGTREGDCTVNGEACEFRLAGNHLSYRVNGEDEWRDFEIVTASGTGDGLTLFTCTDLGEHGLTANEDHWLSRSVRSYFSHRYAEAILWGEMNAEGVASGRAIWQAWEETAAQFTEYSRDLIDDYVEDELEEVNPDPTERTKARAERRQAQAQMDTEDAAFRAAKDTDTKGAVDGAE